MEVWLLMIMLLALVAEIPALLVLNPWRRRRRWCWFCWLQVQPTSTGSAKAQGWVGAAAGAWSGTKGMSARPQQNSSLWRRGHLKQWCQWRLRWWGRRQGGHRGSGVGETGICASITVWGDWLGVIDVSEGDGVWQERGDNRLDSSSPSLSNSTPHCLFLVCLAGGEHGGGDSAGCDSAG